MGLSAFQPEAMRSRPLFGVNLAILYYGLGLIAAAWVLAFLYAYLCRRPSGGGQDPR